MITFFNRLACALRIGSLRRKIRRLEKWSAHFTAPNGAAWKLAESVRRGMIRDNQDELRRLKTELHVLVAQNGTSPMSGNRGLRMQSRPIEPGAPCYEGMFHPRGEFRDVVDEMLREQNEINRRRDR